MVAPVRLIPIYTSQGDIGAFLAYPYLYSLDGEWIGWVTANRQVYSVMGAFVGELTKDPRIVRRRSEETSRPRLAPPHPPIRLRPPTVRPLPPLLAELSFGMLDVLDETPYLLHPVDSGDLREDLD
jgi:hypothetical protein